MTDIKQSFQETGEAVIASYNYQDLTDGTGIVDFYLANTNDADDYILTGQNIYASDIESVTAFSLNTTPTKRLDYDFDLSPFQTPRALDGTAVVSVGAAVRTGGVAVAPSFYAIVKIRKWDGTTETDLVSGQSQTKVGSAAANTTTAATLTTSMTIPRTTFRDGDQLRVTIEIWAWISSGTLTCDVSIAHDPANRDGPYVTPSTNADVITSSIAKIPFKLELP